MPHKALRARLGFAVAIALRCIVVNKLRTVLIDLAGVLHVGDMPLPGARDALARLRNSDLALRFLTNTTRRTCRRLAADLVNTGFDIRPEEIETAASAARAYVLRHKLHPKLLIHPGISAEFADLSSGKPDSVLLGDAAEGFDYAALDECFRVLMEDRERPLVAMARNRFFRQADGLHLDMGPFVAALEYACERPAVVTGKPAPEFFRGALAAVGADPAETVMIGDDVEADVGGAMALGMAGVLVRTGKYRPEDDERAGALGAEVVDDFGAAVDRLLQGP